MDLLSYLIDTAEYGLEYHFKLHLTECTHLQIIHADIQHEWH